MEFENAQEYKRLYPISFQAPSISEINKYLQLTKNPYVKLCCQGERFWVKVLIYNIETITGMIDNDLIYTKYHNLKFGHIVKFKRENIYQLLKQ